MGLQDFLSKASNGGIGKSIADLSFEHLDVLLLIWHINRNNFTGEHYATRLSQAFGGEGKHNYEESCVQELFQWKILEWIKEKETFRINPALNDSLDEIVAAWRRLNPNQENYI